MLCTHTCAIYGFRANVLNRVHCTENFDEIWPIGKSIDCQCQSRNSHVLNTSILRHRGIFGAADEAVLNKNFLENKIKISLS